MKKKRSRGTGAARSATATEPRAIGLVLPLEYGYAREVRRGVSDWLRAHPDWSVLDVDEGALRYFGSRGRRLAGCVGFLTGRELLSLARRAADGVVNVSGARPPPPEACSVVNDDREIGRVAARHFIERGWRRLRFASPLSMHFARERWEGLREAARAAGAEIGSFSWEHHEDLLQQLRALPRPAAVVAEQDRAAQTLLREARLAGIAVPSDLAVLGVDDDEFIAESETVPLSSVRPAAREIGRRAAEQIRTGRARPGCVVRVPPEGISVRRSTDSFAVPDARLRRALAALQAGLGGKLDLDLVARESGLCRRNMDLFFRRFLRTTPARWVERLRLARAERLLAGTDLPQEEVAAQCGLGGVVALWRLFRRHGHRSPGAYRARFRRRASPEGQP